MNKTADIIRINGEDCRVEANWNALVAYLKLKGRNDMAGLSALGELAPSDLTELMACCLNEGARLEGSEQKWTGEMVGQSCGMAEMGMFLTIYNRQTSPQIPASKNA